MIEEVVNSILEAEDAADKKIAQARKQASDIVAEAESKAEQQKKQQAVRHPSDRRPPRVRRMYAVRKVL